MLHKGGEVEIAEDVFIARLDGFGYHPRLCPVFCNLAHLGYEKVFGSRIGYRPADAEYLGGISGHQPREVSREDFHTVVIDELVGTRKAKSAICQREKKLPAENRGRWKARAEVRRTGYTPCVVAPTSRPCRP